MMRDLVARYFLIAIGALYVFFSIWCTVRPASTSKAVGFELQPGSGQSEYMVVYGGLEMAMGLLFLLPLVRPNFLGYSLLACALIHGCLAVFRVISFASFTGISKPTYILACLEAAIFVVAVSLLLTSSK